MTTRRNPSPEFWRDRRVLVTGHTGFKGAWLTLWLSHMGARVTGVALPPSTVPSLFDRAAVWTSCDSRVCDIRDAAALAKIVHKIKPEIVFHLAAQALVRAGYRDPLATFATNVQGTANLLEAVRGNGARVVVAITTDKVYHNLEHPYPYRETDALGGFDPYSASKAAAEIVISCYRDSFLAVDGVAVASARAGNVIGGGDWSEDRLIPDAVRAWTAGRALPVRRPDATRPWQHVLEPLAAYLLLAETIAADPARSGAYNFGPETHEAATVRRVVELARQAFGGGEVMWGDGTAGPHEAGWLALEIAKARHELGVVPRWPLTEAVGRAIRWYRAELEGTAAATLCANDIAAFEATT